MSSQNPYSELLSEDVSSEPTNPPLKRPRLISTDCSKQSNAEESEAKETPTQELIQQRSRQIATKERDSESSVSLVTAIERLKAHLKNPKKTEQALVLLRRLTEEKYDALNADAFNSAFMSFSPSLVDPVRSEFGLLCEIITVMKMRIADDISVSSKYYVDSWFLETVVRRDISTDDTVQFSKSCRLVQTYAENLQKEHAAVHKHEDGRTADDNLRIESAAFKYRKQSIISCMKEVFRLYKRQWARQQIDSLFRTVSDRRLLFDGEQLEEIDGLFNKHAIEKYGASVNLAPIAVRAYDSTYHPARSKNLGALK